MIQLSKHLMLSDHAVMREVEDEAILLNLETNQYFALNPAGARMLEVLMHSPSIGQAFSSLLEEYAVEAEVLNADFQELVDQLIANGLVEIV